MNDRETARKNLLHGYEIETAIEKARGEDGAALNLAEEALLLFEELKEDEK